MELKLGDKIFEVDENLSLYNNYRLKFQKLAIEQSLNYCDLYYKSSTIQEALQAYDEFYSNCITKATKLACKILFDKKIYNVSTDRFIDKYYDNLISTEYDIKSIFEKMSEVEEVEAQLEENLEIRKASRGHWEGGGFGLKGAIKGAVTAGALNAAGGIFHGIGDMFRSASNNSKIRSMYKEIYEDEFTIVKLYNSFHNMCLGVFKGLIYELSSNELMEMIEFNEDEAMEILTNAEEFSTNKSQLREILEQCIFINPYEVELYITILRNGISLDGFSEFADFFGMYERIYCENAFVLKYRIYNCSKMSEYTIEDCCKKLEEYVKAHLDTWNEKNCNISDLQNKILDKCKSIKNIDEALSYLKRSNRTDVRNILSDIILKLEDRKYLIGKKEELSKILNKPQNNAQDILSKIKSLLEYSGKYEYDVTEKVFELSVNFALRKNSYEYIKQFEKIYQYAPKEKYYFVTTIISAVSIKNELIKIDEKIPCNTIYTHSPQLFDIVNEARKGNPACQLWLSILFFNNTYIKSMREGFVSRDTKQKEIAETLYESISNPILYFFDKPEKYSFDLFMRLRFNGIKITQLKEYAEILESFKENNECPAGMFEYGKALYYTGNKEKGINIIKNSAMLGYMSAVKFLSDFYKNDVKETLYYRILLEADYKYNLLYQYDEMEFDYNISVNLKQINLFLNGEVSYSIYGDKAYTEYLYNSFTDFEFSEYEKDFENIGYWCGDIGDKFILKTAKMLVSAQKNEKALLSLGKKGDDVVYLFTDENLRFKLSYVTSEFSYSKEIDAETYKLFKSKSSDGSIIYQMFLNTYYSLKKYTPFISVETLEKMAFCGNPFAICNLLNNKKYNVSDDKKEIYNKIKSKWLSNGHYFAVCPSCFTVRTKDDVFCPECGSKIY